MPPLISHRSFPITTRLSGLSIFSLILSAFAIAAEPDCGLKCLYVAEIALGRDAEYNRFLESCPRPGTDGLSMATLSDVATEHGFQTRAVSTTFDRLEKRAEQESFACIALLDDDHFVVFADVNGSQVSVLDPPTRYEADRRVLATRWNGEALLISSGELQAETTLAETRSWNAIVLAFVSGLLILGITLWSRIRR